MKTGAQFDSMPPDSVFDDLYEQYGKPLEPDHRGEYLAVSREGKTVLGRTLLEVGKRAVTELGRGSLVFRIGEPAGAVGRLR